MGISFKHKELSREARICLLVINVGLLGEEKHREEYTRKLFKIRYGDYLMKTVLSVLEENILPISLLL